MPRMKNHISPTDYLTVAQAARLIPGKPHPSAVWRWCRRGIVARNGVRIRMRHGRAGCRIFTTREWMSAYFEALAQADCEALDSEQRAPAPIQRRRGRPRSAAERERAIRQAEEELDRMGI